MSVNKNIEFICITMIFFFGCTTSSAVKKVDFSAGNQKSDLNQRDEKVQVENETSDSIEIEISLTEKCRWVPPSKEGEVIDPSIFLGSFHVHITNKKDHEVALAHLSPANFRFIRLLDRNEFSFFHSCMPGFLFFPWDEDMLLKKRRHIIEHPEDKFFIGEETNGGEIIFISPGESWEFDIIQWFCGDESIHYWQPIGEGQFSGGNYIVMYKIHELWPDSTYQKIPDFDAMKLQALKEFWNGSYESNKLQVEIFEDKRIRGKTLSDREIDEVLKEVKDNVNDSRGR